jgi:hypothetical protein
MLRTFSREIFDNCLIKLLFLATTFSLSSSRGLKTELFIKKIISEFQEKTRGLKAEKSSLNTIFKTAKRIFEILEVEKDLFKAKVDTLDDGFTGVITVFQLLRHKILLLMIEGLGRRDGAEEVSPPTRDALVRKRTNAAIFTDLSNLFTFCFYLSLPYMLI